MKNYIKKAAIVLSLAIAMIVPMNVHADEYGSEAAENVDLAISSETGEFYSGEDIYNDSISMYDSEAFALYEQYLAQAPANISDGDEFAVAALEGFAQYAVEEGIIEDTVVQRAAITKAVVRAEFKLVVAGGNLLGYNNVNYSVTGVKSNGIWTLTIKFTDTYDFDAVAWKNAMTDNNLVTILNNYAAYAQSIGAIVPYNVTVTVVTTF